MHPSLTLPYCHPSPCAVCERSGPTEGNRPGEKSPGLAGVWWMTNTQRCPTTSSSAQPQTHTLPSQAGTVRNGKYRVSFMCESDAVNHGPLSAGPKAPSGLLSHGPLGTNLAAFNKSFFFLIPNFLEENSIIKFFRIKIIFTL